MATKKKTTSVAQKSKATKAAAKKSVPQKKAVAKKASPVKKAVAKKAAPKKAGTSKEKKSTKAAAPKKAASKLSKEQKSSIKKQTPVKKTAKAGVKKAVPKKLATTKKNAVTKPTAAAKKTAPKKENNSPKASAAAAKKPAVTKSIKEKTPEKTSSSKTAKPGKHKAELKKAIAKVKAQHEEEKAPKKPFVMPKTNTEKARKYEPEFTKSVLDQSPAENNGPSMRYSDNELMEFRELITRKLETAKKELGYLQGLITRKDQMGGDESDNRYMTMEDGSLSMEREQLSQMASRQITFIDHLEKAMMRIENKTYGICRVTGKLIDKARLRAVPHATLSIEAKMGINR
jgi:RNA polymerase-binding transcription factor DksA